MQKSIRTKKPMRLAWLGGCVILVAICITGIVSWMLYKHTVNLLTDNLRQRLLSIATTQVANIDSRDIEVLQIEEDWEKPAWSKVTQQLKRAKDNNANIVFMYIFRKKKDDPSAMEFVVDAESLNPYANIDDSSENDVDANGDGKIEPDGPDKLQWPGQDYPEPPEESFKAYNGPLTNHELYEDAYGKVLTGYAPIKDAKGNTIAILGTDIKADDFFVVTKQTLYPFLMFIVFLIAAIVILSTVLIKLWNKRVEMFAELDRQKDELISIVSHQLAAPVTAMKWYIEMLLDGEIGTISSEQKEQLSTMQKVGADLNDLVSMILDVSRIQLGRMKLDPQPLDLNEFFKEIIDVIEPKAKEKGVGLTKHIPEKLPPAKLDKRMTRMTVENLLTNAVKYTPKSGQVSMSVKIKPGNILHCEVKDTGCGIPKAEHDKIFGKLFRASNVQNNVDGNGFGLYIVKGAVEGQGGKVWFESEENRGTTFFIELPFAQKMDRTVQ